MGITSKVTLLFQIKILSLIKNVNDVVDAENEVFVRNQIKKIMKLAWRQMINFEWK